MEEPPKIVENTAKQNLQPLNTLQTILNILQGDSEDTQEEGVTLASAEGGSSVNTLTATESRISNVNIKELSVNLATEERGGSVNALTGTECNIVYLTGDEEQKCKLDSVGGGSSVTALTGECEGEQNFKLTNMGGGSSVTALTGTECNNIYLTDEEEFMEVITIKTVMKTSKKVKESSKSSSQKRHKSRIMNEADYVR